jgi:hypothetical protein
MSKIYYTKKEVMKILENFIDSAKGTDREKYITDEIIKEFDTYGFNCIYNYCETSLGWVASFEDCCPFCVHIIIKNHGTKEDKIKFNKNMDLKEDYIIPLTKKDIALDVKRRIKKKSKKKINNRIGKMSNQSLRKEYKIMKDNNISIVGRTKKNLYKNIFRYIDIGTRNFNGMCYVKGINRMSGIPCISDLTELDTCIAKELKKQLSKSRGLSNVVL